MFNIGGGACLQFCSYLIIFGCTSINDRSFLIFFFKIWLQSVLRKMANFREEKSDKLSQQNEKNNAKFQKNDGKM